MIRTAAIAAVAAIALAAGCSEVLPWECDDSTECVVDDEQGVCTAYSLCAFHDDTCPGPSFLRYDESASDLAEVCVGDEED